MTRRAPPPIPRRPSKVPKRLETDLKTLADAANEAARREAAQWFYFVTIMITLAAIVGSTTHRMLLLDEPVKVPLLQVELPLRGFYVVAPAIFVVLHFYLLAQVRLMAGKVRAFLDAAEAEAGGRNEAFRKALHRLDGFSVGQLVVADRLGHVAPAVRAMAWVTLVIAPILLLLFFQLRFLPFHSEWITAWQRLLIFVDLMLVWSLWPPLESGPRARVAIHLARLGGVAVVMYFSALVATMPGERLDRAGGDLALKRLLFDGEVDAVTRHASSLFARRLILYGEDVVPEADAALATVERTRSLRGRDLSFAVFDGADLRRVDFTGAILAGAEMRAARLNNAILLDADLRGATLDGADMRGTIMLNAWLHGASLVSAILDGAVMAGGFNPIMNRQYSGTALVAARLDCASLNGAHLLRADLRGASLVDVDFGAAGSGDLLASVDLRGAVVSSGIRGGPKVAGALTHVQVFAGRAGRPHCFQAWDVATHDRDARPAATPRSAVDPARHMPSEDAAALLLDLACDPRHGMHVRRALIGQFGAGDPRAAGAIRTDAATWRRFAAGGGAGQCPAPAAASAR
jgi:uncharacterized protein YjbI with pentapeptide repeats